MRSIAPGPFSADFRISIPCERRISDFLYCKREQENRFYSCCIQCQKRLYQNIPDWLLRTFPADTIRHPLPLSSRFRLRIPRSSDLSVRSFNSFLSFCKIRSEPLQVMHNNVNQKISNKKATKERLLRIIFML